MANQQGANGGLRELALFAGAGGGILGGHLLGWQTVYAVERDAYAACVLSQRQTDGFLPPFPIWSDVCSFDGRPLRGLVDVVSGGFPCQEISVAGSGAGLDGPRSGLWSQMARIIGEVRPEYAYIENSPRLVVLGLDRVLADLASLGFDAEWGVLSAVDLGAPHDRERLWIVARNISNANRLWELQPERRERDEWRRTGDLRAQVPDADGDCIQGMVSESQPSGHGRPARLHRGAGSARVWNAWPPEPDVGRVVDGMANRLDAVKAVGNGQVARVAASAFTLLCERAGWEW